MFDEKVVLSYQKDLILGLIVIEILNDYFLLWLGEYSSLVMEMISYIRTILIEDEEKMYDKAWIKQEARDHRYLPNYGTLRQALIQCIKEKIAPIMTQILLRLNQFRNLLILKNERYRELWLKLASILLSERIPVEMGNQAQQWACRFPFFFEILSRIENSLKVHHVTDASDAADISRYLGVFNALKFSPLLEHLSQDQIVDYINDFVHVKYPGLSVTVYDTLADNLLLITHRYRANSGGVSPLLLVHIAFAQEVNQKRLQHSALLLNTMAKMFPTHSPHLDQNLYGTEMVLDVFTLHQLCSKLQLTPLTMSKMQTLSVWASKVIL